MADVSTILIVEDDEEVAFLIKFMLEREGYVVHHANDGQKAFDFVHSQPSPHIAILDIMLPFKDGYEILREIRSSNTWKTCPVIMLTAKGQSHDITRALEAGADDYIVKPFQPTEFLARIKKIMKK